MIISPLSKRYPRAPSLPSCLDCPILGASDPSPPNESLQRTSARPKEVVAVEWLDSAQTCILVSRMDVWPLAAELGR